MAFHAARSGLRAEAARLFLDLARRASARHAYLDAELLYRNALENLRATTPPERLTANQGLGLIRFRLGRHDDALKNFAAALDLARQVGAKAAQLAILLDEAVVLDWTMDWPKSRALSEEAEAMAAATRRWRHRGSGRVCSWRAGGPDAPEPVRRRDREPSVKRSSCREGR